MLVVQNVFVLFLLLLSIYFSLKKKHSIVLIIVVIGAINGPLLKIFGLALPFYYLSMIPLVISKATNLEKGILSFSIKSKEATYPNMLVALIFLAILSTYIIEKRIFVNEILIQGFVGAFFRLIWLLLVMDLLKLLSTDSLLKLINIILFILIFGNLVASLIQLFFGFPEVFYSLYYSPSVTPLSGPLRHGRFYRGYGLFPSPVNLGPAAVLLAAVSLSTRKYFSFFASLFMGLLSLSKSAILGIPIVFFLWLISKILGIRGLNEKLNQSKKIALIIGTILIVIFLPIFINIMEQKGFFVSYYLNYLIKPTKALSSRYDVDNTNIWLAETYKVIEKYPLLGTGYTRIRNENIGDSTYVVILKQSGFIGLGIYLATMIGIVIYFIRKKRLFFLIPISTLIVGLGGNFLISFEHMFFVVVLMLLQSKQCLTTNKINGF